MSRNLVNNYNTDFTYDGYIGFSKNTRQGANSVAIGIQSAQTGQATSAVAIGDRAGQNNQGFSSVAIGIQAGQTTQGSNNLITI